MNKTNIYLFKAMKMDGVNEAVAASGGAGAAVSGGKASIAYAVTKTAAFFSGIGALIGAFFMLMLAPPTTRKETALLFGCLIFGAYSGSAFVIFSYGWDLPNSLDGHTIRSGLAAICGAFSWLFIKGCISWSKQNPDKNIFDLAKQLLALWRGQ